MTNFVAANHGWKRRANLEPSAHHGIEITNEQRDMHNPTVRDVQIGEILDQCIGDKAKKRIAKRRIDFVTGNINSYARCLNGPRQLEKIKTYNQLAASMAELQKEKMEQKAVNSADKKKAEEEKAAKKLEKDRKDKEEYVRQLPICSAHIEKGIQHILSLTVPEKISILKHIYNHEEAKSNLKKARADELLSALVNMVPPLPLPPLESVDNVAAGAEEDEVVLPNIEEEVVLGGEEVPAPPINNTNATWLLDHSNRMRTDVGTDMSTLDLANIAVRELDKIELSLNSGYQYDNPTYVRKFRAAFRQRNLDSNKQVSDSFIQDLAEKCVELIEDDDINEEQMNAVAAVMVARVKGLCKGR